MTTKKKLASDTAMDSKAKPKLKKLPPDPDGLFKGAARRAKKVIAMYENLNPGSGRDYLVCNILHDLMHLCDRDATLGDFDKGHGYAYDLYETLVAEILQELQWAKRHKSKAKLC